MDMQTTKVRGKFFTVVRDGAPVVHITRKYLTRRMAEAAAKCWVAFRGVRKVEIDLNQVYVQGTKRVAAQFVADRVAEAYRFGLTVEVRQGTAGRRYIQISDGKGSAYGQYFFGGDLQSAPEVRNTRTTTEQTRGSGTMQVTATGDKVDDRVTVVTGAGTKVEMTIFTARDVFYQVEMWRMHRRHRETSSAMRKRGEIAAQMGRLGMTFDDARALADWYGETIYNPQRPWTCPI
ncbi:hypothetical protein [Streptomyces fumanus]|uniref:hypothetical protein n=1 Tax=Streptomyces fumanus TaxID=67302 RepID=UPI0033E9169E